MEQTRFYSLYNKDFHEINGAICYLESFKFLKSFDENMSKACVICKLDHT